MSTFTWVIVSMILLTITIFVHKHTYWQKEHWDGHKYYKKEHKMPLPIWLFILMVIIAFVPVLNILAFGVGLLIYCIYRCDPPLDVTPYFKCELGWWRALIEFLTKEV